MEIEEDKDTAWKQQKTWEIMVGKVENWGIAEFHLC